MDSDGPKVLMEHFIKRCFIKSKVIQGKASPGSVTPIENEMQLDVRRMSSLVLSHRCQRQQWAQGNTQTIGGNDL